MKQLLALRVSREDAAPYNQEKKDPKKRKMRSSKASLLARSVELEDIDQRVNQHPLSITTAGSDP